MPGGRGRRDNQRVQEYRPEKAGTPEIFLQKQGDAEGQRHKQRHADQNEPEGVENSQLKGRTLENVPVIFKANKNDPAGTFGEGVPDAPQKGNQVKQAKPSQKRQDKSRPFQGIPRAELHMTASLFRQIQLNLFDGVIQRFLIGDVLIKIWIHFIYQN